jgi:phage-related protein
MADPKPVLKGLDWVGSSRKDLKALPREVCRRFGFALGIVQRGTTPDNAKPLSGFGVD